MASSQTVGSATFTYGEKVLYIWRSICFDSEKKNIWWKIWLNYDQMKLIGYIHWECAEDKSNTHTQKSHVWADKNRFRCQLHSFNFDCLMTHSTWFDGLWARTLYGHIWWFSGMPFSNSNSDFIAHSTPKAPKPVTHLCTAIGLLWAMFDGANKPSHNDHLKWFVFFFSLTSSNPSRKYRRVCVCVHANARARANKICAHAWCCWSSF